MVALPRTVTNGELTMHVQHEGEWHRRTPDLKTTACGERFHSQFSPTRREELVHPLCRAGCFTRHELDLADEQETRQRMLEEIDQ